MDVSTASVRPSMGMGIPVARSTLSAKVAEARDRYRRTVAETKEEISSYARQVEEKHPGKTKALKTFGKYAIKTHKVIGRGLLGTCRLVAKVNRTINHYYNRVQTYIETRFPKLAIAVKVISQFALNPLFSALRGMSIATLGLAGTALLFPAAPVAAAVAPVLIGGILLGAGVGITRAAINSAQYTVKVDGAEKHRILAKAVGLYERAVKPVKDLDAKLENLHPALSISYKALKEIPMAVVDTLAAWFGGSIGIIAADINTSGGLSYTTSDTLARATLVGGLIMGPAHAAWNIGTFACKRISDHYEARLVAKANEVSQAPAEEQKVIIEA